jgi:hypothetical protein
MEGSGACSVLNARSNECLFRGRVEDSYPAQSGCIVAVYALASNFPCVVASDIHGRIFGAKSCSIPPVGTEVVVYVKDGSNYGIIIGVLPTVEDSKCDLHRPMVCHEGGVNNISLKEAFNAEEFKITPQYLPDAGASSAIDVIPGDQGWSNDLNMFLGLLRAVAVLKGGEFSKVEAFAIDDLLRITGYNLEELTSGSEKRHVNDNGAVTKEETIAFNQNEALGVPDAETPMATEQRVSLKTDPEKIGLAPIVERMIGKWRYREYIGYLGDLCHRIISRPVSGTESLNQSDSPDGGVFSEHISRTGKVSSRSLAGMGFHKVDRIPVPKRKWFFGEIHDKQYPSPEPKQDFKLYDDEIGPAAAFSKLRDYFAYVFSSVVPARMYESKDVKELSLPENSECPDLALIKSVPSIGGFFREFPEDKNLSGEVDGLLSEPIATTTMVKPGHSWVDVLPDGSISMRDIWGSSIEMRGGHIYISASKSIQMLSGESIVSIAGRDIIGKANKAIDMTCTSGQMRLKSDRTMFLHSQSAGVQVTCPADNAPNSPMKPYLGQLGGEAGVEYSESAGQDEMIGELYDIPGFVVKTNTSASVVSKIMSMYLSDAMYITNQDGEESGKYPVVCRNISGEISTLNDFGLFYKYGQGSDSYGYIGDGGFYGTGDVYMDGNGYFRKQIGYNFDSDSTIPTVREQLEPQYPDEDVDPKYPFIFEALEDVKFSYRSVNSYGTTGASWFESDWQRDLSDELESWEEDPTEETYPYPGTEYYISEQKYFTYSEVNVEAGGAPIDRIQMSEKGGEFSGNSWNQIKVSAKLN